MPIHHDFLTPFLLGALLGSLVTLSLVHLWLGRILVRFLAVVALGLGAFMLIWPGVSMIRREQELRGLRGIGIETVSEAFGLSGFLFVFGGLALGFSFLGGRKKPEQPAAPVEDAATTDVPPPPPTLQL
jgi:hypothetical protein